MLLIQIKIVLLDKEKQAHVAFNLDQINSSCVNYHQYIQNKIQNKLHMKAINYARFKLEQKTTRSVKKNKNYFINVIGEKCVMGIK